MIDKDLGNTPRFLLCPWLMGSSCSHCALLHVSLLHINFLCCSALCTEISLLDICVVHKAVTTKLALYMLRANPSRFKESKLKYAPTKRGWSGEIEHWGNMDIEP